MLDYDNRGVEELRALLPEERVEKKTDSFLWPVIAVISVLAIVLYALL